MRRLLIGGLVLALVGCATAHKEWVMVGGSKADGTVVLGIDIPPSGWTIDTTVTWDANQANAEAKRRCANWGYADADMYRAGQLPVREACTGGPGAPCSQKTYRIQYQCLGGK